MENIDEAIKLVEESLSKISLKTAEGVLAHTRTEGVLDLLRCMETGLDLVFDSYGAVETACTSYGIPVPDVGVKSYSALDDVKSAIIGGL